MDMPVLAAVGFLFCYTFGELLQVIRLYIRNKTVFFAFQIITLFLVLLITGQLLFLESAGRRAESSLFAEKILMGWNPIR